MQKLAYKVCVFGDGGVGKTTLINRYLTKVFDEDLKMTIGADFSVKDVDVNGRSIRLRIWDFAGEEKFRVLMPSYVQGADGGVFVYDTTRYNSLKNMKEWISFFKAEEESTNKKIPIIMVGSKIDLQEKRAFESDAALERKEEYNLLDHIECSSKTGENVEHIFDKITRLVVEYSDSEQL